MTQNEHEKTRKVPLAVALLAVSGMMAGAIAAVSTDPKMLPFAPLFPTGLAFLFIPVADAARGINRGIAGVLAITVMAGSYLIYFVLLSITIRARRWAGFTGACLILACVFVLNIIGCHKMVEEMSKMH